VEAAGPGREQDRRGHDHRGRLRRGPTLKAESLQDLVKLGRSKPGQLTYATSGSGGAVHLVMEQFLGATGITAVHVPFKGNAPALTALLGG
jgi:tripartite-type tricarboxylate transporter receptor subunit TctC